MKNRFSILTGLFGLTAVAIGGIMLLLNGVTAPVSAQTEPQTAVSQQRTVRVNGVGRVSAQPDRATVRLGVTTAAMTASAALEENSLRLSEVLSVTQAAGIAEENIQTTGLRLQPVYDGNNFESRELTGYRVSNIVELTTADLENFGSLLDRVVAGGGNTIEGIRFSISDNEALRSAAREAAVADARARAEQLTSLLDAELGAVLTITEIGGTTPAPVAFESTADTAAAAVPIASGTQEVEVNIQVTWLLEE